MSAPARGSPRRWARSDARPPDALVEAGDHRYFCGGFFAEDTADARRRRKGAFANPVAADARHSVQGDRAGAGADRGAGGRPAAPAELVRSLWRRLGRGDAGPRLSYPAEHFSLDRLDR